MINYILIIISLIFIISFVLLFSYVQYSKKMQIVMNQYKQNSMNLFILQNVYKYIGHELNLEVMAELICDTLMGLMGLSACSIVIYVSGNEETIVHSLPKHPPNLTLSYLKDNFNKSLFKKFTSQEEILIQNQVNFEQHSTFIKNGTGSFAVVPLWKNNHCLGFLLLEHRYADFFTQTHTLLLKLLLIQMVTAITNAQQYEYMKKLSFVDGLTSIYNRMYFQTTYPTMLSHAINIHSTLAVCIFDIDNFKSFNDIHGHLLADKQLRAVATLGKVTATNYDGIIARYGGEEFVMLLPNKSLEKIKEIIEDFRQQIRLNTLVTASFGISMYLGIPITSDTLLNQADHAMYKAKNSGRNSICIFNKVI